MAHHAHALAEDPDKGLFIDGTWVREKEESECDMEERDGGDYCGRGNERHGNERRWPWQRVWIWLSFVELDGGDRDERCCVTLKGSSRG